MNIKLLCFKHILNIMGNVNTESVIDKLDKMQSDENAWDNWSLKEKHELLNIYYIISQKETAIFNLIYSKHGCDSWEDIFRDFDTLYLKDKAVGVKIAINEINEEIENN